MFLSIKLKTERFTFLFFYFLMLAFAQAQDKKAVGFYQKGEQAFKSHQYEEAKENYEKALERYPDYIPIFYRLGQIAYASRDLSEAEKQYEKLLSLDSENDEYVMAFSFLARRYQQRQEFDRAIEFYQKALSKTPEGSRAYTQMESQLSACQFAKNALENPLVISPKKMGAVLNFKDKQYFPAFTADGESIYFTARTNGGDEDIYKAEKKAETWGEPELLSNIINTDYNEGTCTISADGKTMVFTSCEGRPGFGSCDLFISRFVENEWSNPENMGANVNSSAWDSQATLSADGNVLIFSSDRFGGKGGKDLFVTKLGKEGWSQAENLGPEINTVYDEVSPFLHANGQTLFFASNGHLSIGGFDIFMSDWLKKGFTTPQNVGYSINDGNDQFSLVISADGQKGYYSVELGERVNLYEFELPKELKEKFNPTFYLKGRVEDTQAKPLEVDLQLVDLKSEQVLSTFKTNQNGEYLAVLPSSGDFGLYVEKEGYFFKSLPFSFDQSLMQTNKELNITLEKVEKQKYEVLNNIYFDLGSWELKPESMVELNKLAELIQKNENLKVEISGHTDDVGKEEDNQILSQKRAESVVDFLVKKGIDKTNIVAKGYGESKPILLNDSEQNRRKNRRIELRFL